MFYDNKLSVTDGYIHTKCMERNSESGFVVQFSWQYIYKLRDLVETGLSFSA